MSPNARPDVYTESMTKVETSPGGVGYIRTPARKQIPGLKQDGAKRRPWLTRSLTATKELDPRPATG